jgi:hypothetical protein
MEKHTRGLKTERMFFKDSKNQPYELITIVDDKYVMRNLISGEDSIFNPPIFENSIKEPEETFVEITQAELFDCIDNNDDEQHAKMMEALGIGYFCPFCGGKLCWESDFMMSEVGFFNNNISYIKIDDEDRISELVEKEAEYKKSNILSDTDNIDEDNEKINSDGEYATMYKKETKDGVVSWYEINDAVVGIYTCQNCGKKYEVCDCLPSEQNEYPYFQE